VRKSKRYLLLSLALLALLSCKGNTVMGVTYPDWGGQAPIVQSDNLTDLAELAARLGSVIYHARSGRVVRHFDMDYCTQQITFVAGGAGSTAGIDNTTAHSGGNSGKLLAANVAGGYSYLLCNAIHSNINKLGYMFYVRLAAQNDSFQARVYVCDGDNWKLAGVRWNGVTSVWQVTNDPSFTAWSNVTGIPKPAAGFTMWNNYKIVLDDDLEVLDYMKVGSLAYDLGDVPLYTYATSHGPMMQMVIRAEQDGVVYIDDIVFSEAEP
jgi:hypothetical protein